MLFKNKILPGLGVLVNRNNIIAVKFNEPLVIESKIKNQNLTFTKKNILLDLDMNSAQNVISNECLTPYKNIEELKALNALKTVCEKSGEPAGGLHLRHGRFQRPGRGSQRRKVL